MKESAYLLVLKTSGDKSRAQKLAAFINKEARLVFDGKLKLALSSKDLSLITMFGISRHSATDIYRYYTGSKVFLDAYVSVNSPINSNDDDFAVLKIAGRLAGNSFEALQWLYHRHPEISS